MCGGSWDTARGVEAAPAAARGLGRRQRGYSVLRMPGYDDEDDWVGEPPEGRISRDRADPDYWRQPWPIAAAGTALLLVIVVVVLILH